MPNITAELNHLRIAPRKVRSVVDMIRGQDVDAAKAQMKYLVRRSAGPLEKLLNSAVASAKNNHGLDESQLYIKEIVVDEGMKLKRYKPKGFGMTMPIQKKTSHVRVVLDELSEERKRKKEVRLAQARKMGPVWSEAPSELAAGKDRIKEEKQKVRIEKEVVKGSKKGSAGRIKALGRKFFRRKSV